MPFEMADLHEQIAPCQYGQGFGTRPVTEEMHAFCDAQRSCQCFERVFVRTIANDVDIDVGHMNGCAYQQGIIFLIREAASGNHLPSRSDAPRAFRSQIFQQLLDLWREGVVDRNAFRTVSRRLVRQCRGHAVRHADHGLYAVERSGQAVDAVEQRIVGFRRGMVRDDDARFSACDPGGYCGKDIGGGHGRDDEVRFFPTDDIHQVPKHSRHGDWIGRTTIDDIAPRQLG